MPLEPPPTAPEPPAPDVPPPRPAPVAAIPALLVPPAPAGVPCDDDEPPEHAARPRPQATSAQHGVVIRTPRSVALGFALGTRASLSVAAKYDGMREYRYAGSRIVPRCMKISPHDAGSTRRAQTLVIPARKYSNKSSHSFLASPSRESPGAPVLRRREA